MLTRLVRLESVEQFPEWQITGQRITDHLANLVCPADFILVLVVLAIDEDRIKRPPVAGGVDFRVNNIGARLPRMPRQ